MTHEEIFAKTASAVRDVMALPVTHPILVSQSLEEDLGADSLDCVEIGIHLERVFKIEIDMTDEGISRMRTVGDLVSIVEEKLQK